MSGCKDGPPKFIIPTPNGEEVEYTWFNDNECQEAKVTHSGEKVRTTQSIVPDSKGSKSPKKESKSSDAEEDAKAKKKMLGVATMEKIPLLQQITPEERESLLQSMPILTLSKGSYVVCQGDTIEDLFILLEGNCQCTKLSSDGGCSALEEYTAGMAFGGRKFDSTDQRRAENVIVTSEEATVIRADRVLFSKILTSSMDILLKGKPMDLKDAHDEANGLDDSDIMQVAVRV